MYHKVEAVESGHRIRHFFRTNEVLTKAERERNAMLDEVRDYPLSHVTWAARRCTPMLEDLVVRGGWDELSQSHRMVVTHRMTLGLPLDGYARSPTIMDTNSLTEFVMWRTIREYAAAREITDLRMDHVASPLWLAYADVYQRGGVLMKEAIVTVCRLDLYHRSRGLGAVVVGPSTYVRGRRGAIALGHVAPLYIRLLGHVRERGEWQTLRTPNVDTLDGRAVDATTILSPPAVVIGVTEAGVGPNATLHLVNDEVWLFLRSPVTSTEVVARWPVSSKP